MLGSAGDVLGGSTIASDPRLAAAGTASSSSSSPSPSSSLALEIAGTSEWEAPIPVAAAATAAPSQRRKLQIRGSSYPGEASGRKRGTQNSQGRFVALSGTLVCFGEGTTRGWGGDAGSEGGGGGVSRRLGRGRHDADINENGIDDAQYRLGGA